MAKVGRTLVAHAATPRDGPHIANGWRRKPGSRSSGWTHSLETGTGARPIAGLLQAEHRGARKLDMLSLIEASDEHFVWMLEGSEACPLHGLTQPPGGVAECGSELTGGSGTSKVFALARRAVRESPCLASSAQAGLRGRLRSLGKLGLLGMAKSLGIRLEGGSIGQIASGHSRLSHCTKTAIYCGGNETRDRGLGPSDARRGYWFGV